MATSVVDGVGVESIEEEDVVTVLFAKEVCRGRTFASTIHAASKAHSFRLDIFQQNRVVSAKQQESNATIRCYRGKSKNMDMREILLEARTLTSSHRDALLYMAGPSALTSDVQGYPVNSLAGHLEMAVGLPSQYRG